VEIDCRRDMLYQVVSGLVLKMHVKCGDVTGPPIYGRFPGNLLQGTFNILMLDLIAYTIVR